MRHPVSALGPAVRHAHQAGRTERCYVGLPERDSVELVLEHPGDAELLVLGMFGRVPQRPKSSPSPA